ncbi:MAG: nucleoside hydrolase, partial [Acidithiobacillus sp.]|uniref:nucleoside hydrolase n=1 Tax=Acidithiobacillus sp. TaxID=1872118 RepID=UPI0025881F12
VELRAVVSTHAPNLPQPAAESSAAECRAVLSRLPGGDVVDVLAGSSEPLKDAGSPRINAGVERIIEEARRCGYGRLTVLAIGAATDVASALLAAPDIADRVEVLAMGFQGWEAGGDEWNVKNDPAAWQALLSSSVPITVGDAMVCQQRLRLNVAQAAALLGDSGSVGPYLADLMATWIAENGEVARLVTGRADTWPVWDEVVVAHLLGLTFAADLPRPVLRDDLRFEHGGAGQIRWIHWVDSDRLWSDLATRCSET